MTGVTLTRERCGLTRENAGGRAAVEAIPRAEQPVTNTLDAFARAATHPLLRVTPRTNNDGPQDAISHLNTPVRTGIVRVQRALRLLAGSALFVAIQFVSRRKADE